MRTPMRPHYPLPTLGEPTNSFFMDLSPSARTAYAQVADHAIVSSLRRTVGGLTGSFAKKTVAGKEYWYFQYRELRELDEKGSVRQVYLGPRNERLDRLIAIREDAREVANALPDQVAMQARAAIALGNFGIAPAQMRVLKRLDDYGYFRCGGVLVGTHAFACYGNMFGVAWGNFQMTQDLDFAYGGRNLSIALPSDAQINVDDAITSLEMGFLPSMKLNGTAGGTYVVPESPDFRLDFLTTCGRDDSELVHFPGLNLAMVPLKFMEFSLEDIHQAVVLSNDGAVVVNVPSPARFALHKLIVAGERSGSFITKIRKDLWQAAALMTYLTNHQPERLASAWLDLIGRGKGWKKRFELGLAAMQRELPETRPMVERAIREVEHYREMSEGDDDDAPGSGLRDETSDGHAAP